MRKVRNILFTSLAAVSVFFAGIALACDGNYAENWDTLDCVTLDVWENTSACKTLDSSGQRCWNCSREKFLCLEEGYVVERDGPAFNCNTPGAACN